MSIWNAIVLGLVKGITEFLPVSSSAHLSITNNLFDMSTADNGHIFFEVLLNLGIFAALCVVYWQELVQMFREILGVMNLGPYAGDQRRHRPGARLFIMLLLASLPLLLIIPIHRFLDSIFDNHIIIGILLVLNGCILFVSDRMKQGTKTETNLTVLDSIIIGLCQTVGVIPGLSRIGTTVTAGIAAGLRPDFALRFSFLLSLPVILGADIMDLTEAIRCGIDVASVPAYLLGMLAAMVSGIAVISLFKHFFSSKGKFKGFAYYCWVMGVLSIILTMIF
ncbi:MAG: undecaprenyl-diphosphate phosphatase [Candidatus Limivicinus sp.]|jgi:undecaprenyl-diphosphatase